MSIVAIIPARGGSKRIPNKNIRPFAGRPIIAYSIAAARESGLFDRIIVSTDSDEVAAVAERWGAEVPFRRPPELATDFAVTADVILHAVQWLRQNGGCNHACCIYATAPFLTPEYLRRGFEQMQENNAGSAVSVARFTYPIQRALKMNGHERIEMFAPEHRTTRSQDLEPAYHDAAQFYWVQADYFLEQRTFLLSKPVGVLLPARMVHDIDTPEDWEVAELKFQALHRDGAPLANPDAELPSTLSPLVLGTAQLGFTYGIANRVGRPDAHATNVILCAAWAGGIRCFDTAQAYGDSEYVLGDFFAGSYGFSDVRFISKLHPDVNTQDGREIRRHVEESLRRLKATHLWALLLHREEHLDQWAGTLGQTLRALRCEGLVRHLGLSAYSPEFARRALEYPDIAILELPANVFDRRARRSGLELMARDANKLVLVRSIFLQGLALLKPDEVPADISGARAAVTALSNFCQQHGLDRREFAYDYVRASHPGAYIVMGAETTEQVTENCRLPQRPPLDPRLLAAWDAIWPVDEPALANPSLWRKTLQPNPETVQEPGT